MRWSNAFIPTLREDPKDAEAVSHKLMMRAGLVRRLGSGAYSYLPLAVRALKKVIQIIREEMDGAGAQEVLLPSLQPIELWKKTGRDALLGDILIRFKDRTGKDMVLGPTHEEVITDLASEIKSHKQLPVTLYQIQTKFRDEPRPRFGIIRSKEFIMKDAYSFDVDAKGLDASYQKMFDAYKRIFRRCGVKALPCEADTGIMGGQGSHEFMAPAAAGEDTVVQCSQCDYAANREAAKCRPPVSGASGGAADESPLPLKDVETPGQHTVEQVSGFFKISPAKLLKTLIYDSEQGPVAVVIRGDHEVNEVKLARVLGTPKLRLASGGTIERLTGAPVGFSGPVGLQGVRLVADELAMKVINAVAGANKAERHVINVNPGRDFTPAQVADIRLVSEGDQCIKCGAPLKFVRTIEVGHVFKLGTKYSQALGAVVQVDQAKPTPMVMGCYGIGVNRILATVIEQSHDANGIIWPASIAPYQVIVTLLDPEMAGHRQLGEEVAEALRRPGRDVLLDDRVQSPGSKLKDADLIGIPVQVVIGRAWEQEKKLEVIDRATKTRQPVDRDQMVVVVDKLLDKPDTAE